VRLERPAGVTLPGHPLPVIAAAAARATAADRGLVGRGSEVMRAKRVVVALGREAGFGARQIAQHLGCDSDTVGRLGRSRDPDDLVSARRVLAIDAALAARRARAA